MSDDATLNEFVDANDTNQQDSEVTEHGRSEEDLAQELFGIGEIPKTWSIEPLSESANIIAGNSPPSSTYNEVGDGLPFFQGNSEFNHFHPEADTWCSDPRKVAETNDILISIRAPVGDLNIANQRCCIGRGLAALRPDDMNGLYLFYHLSERGAWLSRLATGSTFKSITKGDLQHLDIPVPPFSEQRKIATVLHTVDQAIQKPEVMIEQSKKLKRGIKQDLLSEGYHQHETEQRRIGAKLRKIPSEWETAELGELAEYQNGYGFSKEQWSDTGRLIIRIQDLTTPEESDRNYFDGEIDSKYEVENGDILVSWSATLGVFKWNRGDAVLNQHIFKVRNIEDIVSEQFLYHILDDSLTELERKLHGSTMKHVTRSAFEGTEVPLPPKNEQIQIAKTLDDIDQQIQSHQKHRSKLQRVKNGLMQDLLSGEVRTTDVNIDIPQEVEKYG